MRSWPAVDVPRLPAPPEPLALRVHDTASNGLVRAAAAADAARLYVCGITPYDATHLGHAATYLTFDTLVRAWRDQGHEVLYVQNVTDIDDPLLERAARDGVRWEDVAERETDLFRSDMTALRVVPPTWYVGAVEAMDEIADLVVRLQDAGATYAVDGDIYFSVAAAQRFGPSATSTSRPCCGCPPSAAAIPTGRARRTRSTACCGCSSGPGEPGWPSPFGPGRPGWHVECAAMALARLGATMDVQGGGSDLVFPHHELSAAEAEVVTGEAPFARAYVHAGMVGPRRREDEQVARQPRLRLAAARRPARTPARCDWPCSPSTTGRDREWTARQAGRRRAAAGALAGSDAASRRAGRSAAAVRRTRLLCTRTSTPRGPWPRSTPGATRTATTPRRPRLVRQTVDALLGIAL